MKRELATLRVILTDEHPSSTGSIDSLEHDFVIYLNPSDDLIHFKDNDIQPTPEALLAILVHELGHFAARLLAPRKTQVALQTGVRTPMEQEAWDLALKIAPNAERKVRDAALSGYEQGDKMAVYQ
jgi:hypothetical protein